MTCRVVFMRAFDAPLAGGGTRRIAAGTELEIDQAKAEKLIAAGIAATVAAVPLPDEPFPPEDPEALPKIGPDGGLIIPMTAPRRFRWWAGGQPPSETLREMFEERAAILEFDAGLSREDAEAQAAIMTGYTPPNRKEQDA
ncbi:hypothetical protein [Trichloromonas sp.]|uniref:hypothetical protein n=1 Tax=Trichloromonas sp. TaxID=3069249 RepID=UPI002A45C5EF|nr:hypothetical protein [Trichloromonas sp.]